RRHHAGLRGEILPAGDGDGGTERALHRGGDAVRRRQDHGGVAEGDQDRRSGVPAAEGARLREVAYPAPAGGGWSPKATGWGTEINVTPPRLMPSAFADPPLSGEG